MSIYAFHKAVANKLLILDDKNARDYNRMKSMHDWEKIQKEFDNDASRFGVSKKFGIGEYVLDKAATLGLLTFTVGRWVKHEP